MAADWLAQKVNGSGCIGVLQGTPGSAPANDRRKAFGEAIAKYLGLKMIDSQNEEQPEDGGGFHAGKGRGYRRDLVGKKAFRAG